MVTFRISLFERIERAAPRLVRITAGAGWGKSTFARELAARAPIGVVCELAGVCGRDDVEMRLSAALEAEAMRAGVASASIDWHDNPSRQTTLVLDDVDALIALPDGPAMLRTLTRTLPPARRLVLTSRAVPPIEISRFLAPHEIVTIGRDDLAFTLAEARAIIGAEGIAPAVLERAAARARGWPIAIFLFARFRREGRLAELLDRLDDDAYADLYEYITHEIVDSFPPEPRELAFVLAALPHATIDEFVEVLDIAPAKLRHDLDELVRSALVERRDDGEYRATSMFAAALQRADPERITAIIGDYARRLGATSRHVREAELWLAAGDDERAAHALERLGPPTSSAVRLRSYMRIVERLPIERLITTEHSFLALFASRRAQAGPRRLFDRVLDLWERTAADAEPRQRLALRIALGICYRYVARFRESDRLLREAEASADDLPLPQSHRLLLLANRAATAAALGRLHEARELWARAAVDGRHDGPIYETSAGELTFSTMLPAGDESTIVALITELEAEARASGDPLVRGYTKTTAGFLRRILGERRTAIDIITAIRRELGGADPLEAKRYTEPAEIAPEKMTRFSCFALVDTATEQTDVETARRLLDVAIDGYDRIGAIYFQISVRVVAAAVPGTNRLRLLQQAREFARAIDEPLLLESIETIIAGGVPERGPLRTLIGRVEHGALRRSLGALRVEILRGQVTRSGEPIGLRAREFELLAALAVARGPLTRDAIADRLWGESEGEGGAALRMSIHRLRKALEHADAVKVVDGGYALGEEISVDLIDIEAFLAALRRLPSMTQRERERLEATFAALTADLPERYAYWTWFASHAVRIADLRHEAGMLLAADALRARQFDDALRTADDLLRVDPHDEPAIEMALRALIATGRETEAQRRWRLYRDALTDELGVEPTLSIERLLQVAG